MKLKLQKRLAAIVAKVGLSRVKINPEFRDDVKEAITKSDVRTLIKDGTISVLQKQGTSRVRARKAHEQRKKNRRKGHGHRKGTKNARNNTKDVWMAKIRLQRALLKSLRDKARLETKDYRNLYLKAKGGYFRSKKHLLTYLEQKDLFRGKR